MRSPPPVTRSRPAHRFRYSPPRADALRRVLENWMPTSPRVRPHAAIPSLLLALALGCGRAHPAAPVYSDGSALVDQSGRHVVLRGVNIRAAGFFDAYRGHLPLPPFAADDCRILGEQLGMSSLRLPVSWSLLEPSRGSFD